MAENSELIQNAVRKLNIGGYTRHALLCIGPSCCTPEEGAAAWEALKAGIKDRGIGAECYRTKVGCLRVCVEGPVMVVYPEGTWYRGVTAERVPQIVERHLAGGEPVEELVFARNPLNEGAADE
jgi:(2Fe-2S) ferredoxin